MKKLENYLFQSFTEITPSVEKIKNAIGLVDNELFNDHIAFRTINSKNVNIWVLADFFARFGYEPAGKYYFQKKKLRGIHLCDPNDISKPKIFISQLMLEKCSPFVQNTLSQAFDKLNKKRISLICSGRNWEVSHKVYMKLLAESEYAAWLYVHGMRVNHFTLNINKLKGYTIESLCAKLLKKGFTLNHSGGIIKGSYALGLKQASIMADQISIKFVDLAYEIKIPSCYVEFAERFLVDGEIFQGFLTNSANYIFESTDNLRNAS